MSTNTSDSLIRTYTLNGKEFQTITIPKGTLLFRGIKYSSDDDTTLLFDLVGMSTSYGRCIAPTNNIFFYPAPYVSDIVTRYNIHILYVTQYDIELLLLVKPSELHRGMKREYTKNNVMTVCSEISKYDKCGWAMSDSDPCITEEAIKQFPNIAGYIGIAESDKESFVSQYAHFIKSGKKIELQHILPSIVSNSREYISIPELVIHPLHLRRTTDFKIRTRCMNIFECVNYTIRYMAQYNFIPLLYITDTNVFSYVQLKSTHVQKQLAKAKEYSDLTKNPGFSILKRIMNRLLSEHGYKINKIKYHATVDTRTGFYRIKSEEEPSSLGYGRLRLIDYNTNTKSIIPYTYSLRDKEKLIKLISRGDHATEEMTEEYLNTLNMSLTRKYVFDKGGNTYRQKFHIDNVLNRRDIKVFDNNALIRNITRKMRAVNNIANGLYNKTRSRTTSNDKDT
jgi:hypothetical protein